MEKKNEKEKKKRKYYCFKYLSDAHLFASMGEGFFSYSSI